MASKVGWTHMHPEGKLASIWLEATKSESFLRRVCVRVDDCPETIKRSELAATVKKWWHVTVGGSDTEEQVVKQIGNCGTWDFVTFGDRWRWAHVTAIRSHAEAPWTKVVEG